MEAGYSNWNKHSKDQSFSRKGRCKESFLYSAPFTLAHWGILVLRALRYGSCVSGITQCYLPPTHVHQKRNEPHLVKHNSIIIVANLSTLWRADAVFPPAGLLIFWSVPLAFPRIAEARLRAQAWHRWQSTDAFKMHGNGTLLAVKRRETLFF